MNQFSNIVLVTDDAYAPYAAVTIASLFEQNSNTNFHIYILTCNFSDENKKLINSLFQKNDNINRTLNILTVDSDCLSLYDGIGDWSKYTFMKLLIPDYLPKDIEKVIYLDTDIYITGNIQELIDYDISAYGLAGVEDAPSCISHKIRLNIPHESLYINSGVMIINLKKWREASQKGYFNDFVNKNKNRMKLNDQDVINSVFQNQIASLHLRYNITNFCYGIHKKLTLTHQKQLKEALKHPVIIHFTNRNKPWIAENFHYFKSVYITTMSHTPYNYLIPNIRVKDRRLWFINGIKYWCAYILDIVKYKI